MADVRLLIASREYIITCRDGEEARLNELASMVDTKVREAGGAAGGLSESRQLLFAALLLADQVKDSVPQISALSNDDPDGLSADATARIAEKLNRLADRLESFATGLEKQG